jgi:transposase
VDGLLRDKTRMATAPRESKKGLIRQILSTSGEDLEQETLERGHGRLNREGIPISRRVGFKGMGGWRPPSMKPYSTDLRERVVARVLSGESTRPVAEAFSVSVASVVRWSQRHRSRGNSKPDKMGRGKAHILDKERSWILDRIANEPDVTLRQLEAELLERGMKVSYGTVWNFVHREDLSFKKKRSSQRTGPAGCGALSGAMEEISDRY